MIDILTNGFLKLPLPLNLNLNYCSHGCSYCFSNLNNPFRKADVSGILSQLKNYKVRNDLVSFYLREGYPVNISNNIDPFSKSNFRLFQQVGNFMLDNEIPMQILTRGGEGWREFNEAMKPSVWYVSVPYSDDKIRERLETNAPSLDERFEMVQELVKKHHVIIGINPMEESFVQYPLEIIRKYEAVGVKHFWINYLHISPKQKKNLGAKQREAIGEDILLRLNKTDPTDWWLNQAKLIIEYCEENDLILHGVTTGEFSMREQIWSDAYGENLLPTEQDFFNHLALNKKEGDLIYFKDFYDFFAPMIPNIETNISKFLFNKAVLTDKSSYKKTSLRDLLHYYWEVKGVSLGLAENYPVFSWVKQKSATKTDFMYDSDHNKVLLYHPENWNLKDYTIID